MALMRLFQGGYPVPDGSILATSFFEPWLSDLQQTPAWKEFLCGEPKTLSGVCLTLQRTIAECRLSSAQQELLAQELGRWQNNSVFAIRSSSPEEDLENASFAGAYKTVLGVKAGEVHSILPAVVASSLDYRVVLYKHNRGFDVRRPRLAVIIQEQVASEVSGVAFSLNPVTGDTTQVIIESAWGLGPAVVGGRVSPDHFVIDKATKNILEARSPMGSLAGDRLQALVALALRVEIEYQRPIDIEWAMRGGDIFILQARPIMEPPKKAK
jgi:rifampicin phosphotransferase